MAKLTRNNIAYDFKISPFIHNVEYENKSYRYVFSSELYKNKFIERIKENRETINSSLSNRFGFKIKNDILADLVLYRKIEKRGFLVFINEEELTCPENIILDGKNLISRI